jgi:anaerobic C4-dicarboxylate transporter DcuA/anaerobic C4-dicarboxylate transporter DcuB
VDIKFWLEAIVMVVFIFLGVRAGGVGLGAWGAAGTLVLIFGFGLPPGSPPTSAMLVIIAVITAASAMQAAGGIDWLVTIAKRILEARPSAIIYVAPPVSFVFTMLAGTSNIFFPLIPVIYRLCYQNGIRPEKALGPSTVASAFGITASPVSAAMAAMITLTAAGGYELSQVLLITVPASLIAIVVFSFAQSRMGKSLANDAEYQRRLAAGEIEPPADELDVAAPLPATAQTSAIMFLTGVFVIVLYGLFQDQIIGFFTNTLGFAFGDPASPTPPDSTTMIQLVMFTIAALIFVVCRVSPGDVPKQQMFGAGMVAMIALFGLAWLADTFVSANEPAIVAALEGIIQSAGPLVAVFAIVFAIFVVAALTTSQSGTTRTIIPIGIALGIPMQYLIAAWQSVAAVLFLPANGTQLAAISIDETGTTKIGKFVINHSFQPSLLIGVAVSVIVGIVIATVLFGTGTTPPA